MTFSAFTRLFRGLRRCANRNAVAAFWIANEDDAALIHPRSGQVFAWVWHDGCGKYHPSVVVSPWRAFRLITREASRLVSLRPFPRVAVELYRLKADGFGEAMEEVEHYIGLK